MAGVLESDGPDITLTAEEAITVGKILKIGSADLTCLLATATSSVPIGISMTAAAASGDAIRVRVHGVANCTAQGTVTRGTRVMWATGSKVLNATGNIQTVGIALASVSVDGDTVPVIICPAPAGTSE